MIDLGLPLEVVGEDGRSYELRPFEATPASIEYLWEFTERNQVLLSDHKVDYKTFTETLLSPGMIILIAVDVTEGADDVGLLYIDKLRPTHSAQAHFIFLDKNLTGRNKVILAAAKWACDQFDFYRLNIELPFYAYAALRRLHDMGVMIEGRRRGALKSKGAWRDVYLFGILRDELTPEVLEAGRISRPSEAVNWYGLLKDDTRLMRAILTEK